MRSAAHRRPSLLFGITGTGVLHLPGDNPGKRAAFAHHDPRPCLIPPDWSGGYTSSFSLQQKEDERASSGGGAMM